MSFKWYFHGKAANETAEALKAAAEGGCGLLVFAGKPGCRICETVWSKSYNGTEMMDGDGKLARYLESHRLVGLRVDDSQSHFSDLSKGVMGYRNADGSVTNTNAPFLALVKVSASPAKTDKLSFSRKDRQVEAFFGGYGSLAMTDKTYARISSWLDGLLASDAYKKAFAGAQAQQPAAPAARPRWTVAVEVSGQMSREYEAATRDEAMRMADADLAKLGMAPPDGWNGAFRAVVQSVEKR